MAKVTNKTEKTPLGIGALGLLVEPGQSVHVSTEDLKTLGESAVVRAWVESEMMEIEPDGADEKKAAKAAAEQAEKEAADREKAEALAAEEAAKANSAPKLPTPTPNRR